MESQFDPRLLLLLDGKGSKLFKASIFTSRRRLLRFSLMCKATNAPQVFLQQCCFSYSPSGQTDNVSSGPDIDIGADVGVYTCGFFTCAHTRTHVSGDCRTSRAVTEEQVKGDKVHKTGLDD